MNNNSYNNQYAPQQGNWQNPAMAQNPPSTGRAKAKAAGIIALIFSLVQIAYLTVTLFVGAKRITFFKDLSALEEMWEEAAVYAIFSVLTVAMIGLLALAGFFYLLEALVAFAQANKEGKKSTGLATFSFWIQLIGLVFAIVILVIAFVAKIEFFNNSTLWEVFETGNLRMFFIVDAAVALIVLVFIAVTKALLKTRGGNKVMAPANWQQGNYGYQYNGQGYQPQQQWNQQPQQQWNQQPQQQWNQQPQQQWNGQPQQWGGQVQQPVQQPEQQWRQNPQTQPQVNEQPEQQVSQQTGQQAAPVEQVDVPAPAVEKADVDISAFEQPAAPQQDALPVDLPEAGTAVDVDTKDLQQGEE